MISRIRTDGHAHHSLYVCAITRLSHRAIRRFSVWTLNRIIYVSLQWTQRRSERMMRQCHREKPSFLHTLILGNQKQTSQKIYKTLIFLITLGRMQKIRHYWAQMKKGPKFQLGRFCPEPFNYLCAIYFHFVFPLYCPCCMLSNTLLLNLAEKK